MKPIFLLFLALGFAPWTVHAAPALTTVDHVDLTRYVGKWHEIASIPQFFQRKCVSDTTAEYETLPDQRIRVYNSCTTQEGERIYSDGRAKVVDPQTNAKLKVTFSHLGDRYFYLLGGKYWIIELDENYNYAIVGHPNRKYGWILARNAALSENTMRNLVKALREHHYDPCDFMITPQTGGATTKARLCDEYN